MRNSLLFNNVVFFSKNNYKRFFCYLSLLLCMVFVSTTSLLASEANVQNKVVEISSKQMTVSELLNAVKKQTGYLVLFSSEDVDLSKVVTLDKGKKDVEVLLSRVFESMGISVELEGNHIILSKSEKTQDSKSIRINGTVLDQQGSPLPGVNVVVKGLQQGTTTDADGNYFLDVPSRSSILVFSYIGFESQEVRVGNMININVNLAEISTGLNEVVVVGYGSQKRASIVGSITTIEPSVLKQGTTRAISNNLAGQVAGILAVQRSGEPGADGSNFWIRGISSFTGAGTSPLVLVDGIERTLDDLNPAEIESFSVLKDASASAVYGVRGANGVILIKTKRGQLGKPSVNVHYEQSFTQPTKLPEYIGSGEYLTLLNELSDNSPYSQETIDNYIKGTDPDLYPNIDWMDLITKDYSTNQRADITINGGSNILRYALVGSYYGERGIFERDKSNSWDSSTKLNKFNLRSNVDINITPTTVATVSIGGYLQETNGMTVSSDDAFSAAFETPPFVHPAVYSTGEYPVVRQRVNPWVQVAEKGYSTYSSSKIESMFALEQDLKFLTPGLKVKGIFSFDRYSRSGIVRSRTPTLYNPATARDDDGNLILTVANDGQDFLDTSSKTEWGNKATYLEGNISYDRTFGKHHVEGLFLYNQRDYQDGSIVPFRRMGIAGRASYTFDGRYIGEFNFGYNGSENFAKGYRFGFFPSIAVGYLLSEEKFMEPYKKTFSKIKIRGSFGLVGNDQLNGRRFAYQTTINSGDGYCWGADGNNYGRAGRWEGDFGIPNLTWETVSKTNVGFELGLWNALDFQIDYFFEHRYDIFMQRNTIPSSAGFRSTPWANFGKVDNQGIDLSLVYNKQINKDWYAGFRGTFTYAVNKIIEQDEAPGVMGTNRQRTGHSVSQLFGLVDEGLFTEADFKKDANGEILVEDGRMVLNDDIPAHAFGPVRPGDIRYKDVNGDGVVNTMDEAAIGGTYDPQIVYGFGGNLRYKNVDFNVFFQGNGRTFRFVGGCYNNFTPGETMGAMGNILTNYNDRWTPENPSQDVFYPRLTYGKSENNVRNSTWWLRNMSMVRMKDVEVGYSFPKEWVQRIGLSNFRLYAKGSNLLTFSGWKLWDPEIDTGTGTKYPIMKSFSVGLDINF